MKIVTSSTRGRENSETWLARLTRASLCSAIVSTGIRPRYSIRRPTSAALGALSEPLTTSLAATRLIDPLALALVRAGEETGRLDDMLLTIAGYFEADVEAAIATLGAVIEPVLIVVLGIVVGFIVFSVFIPLYSLIGSVSR